MTLTWKDVADALNAIDIGDDEPIEKIDIDGKGEDGIGAIRLDDGHVVIWNGPTDQSRIIDTATLDNLRDALRPPNWPPNEDARQWLIAHINAVWPDRRKKASRP